MDINVELVKLCKSEKEKINENQSNRKQNLSRIINYS